MSSNPPLEKRDAPSEMKDRTIAISSGEDKPVENANEQELENRKIYKLGAPVDEKTQESKAEPKKTTAVLKIGSGEPFVFKKDAEGEAKTDGDAKEETEASKKVEDKKANDSASGEKAPVPSLFGNGNAPSFSSIFKNAPSTAAQPIAEAGKPSGLFAGAATANTGSFFSNQSSGLFGGNTGASLFGGTGQTGSLFGGPSQIPSLFGNTNAAKDDDDEGSGDDDDEQREATDEEEIKRKAQEHYEYKSPYEQVVSKAVVNFRVGDEEPIGAGFLSIEKLKAEEENGEKAEEDKKKSPGFPMLVFRNKAKRILHSSILVPRVSTSAFLKNRKDAIALFVLHTPAKKDDNGAKAEESKEAPAKPVKTGVKAAFGTPEDAEEFKKQLDKLNEER